MIQFNTKNNSFLKMHLMLKEMGIKNNAFFLQLFDEDLLYIDPRDNNLPFDIKVKVHNEITNNPWYFFREVMYVPSPGGEIPFILNKLSLAIIWCLMHNINIIVQGPRQCGKSTTPAAFIEWAYHWGTSNTNFALFGLSDEQLCGNIARIKDIRSTLPSYLQLLDKKDSDNARNMRINRGDGSFNTVSIKASGKSEESARNVGRGKTTACQWYDEFAFIEHIKAQYETAVFAYARAARDAAASGSMHHLCMTTTAGWLDTDCGQWAYDMINKAAPFTERFYDMTYEDEDNNLQFDIQEIHNYILSNSAITGKGSVLTAFVSIAYMYYDLDLGDNYLDDMRALVTEEDSFRREILMEWRAASADHPIGQERVAMLQSKRMQPVDVMVIDDLYFLNFYRKPEDIDWNIPYVCAADIGSNTGSDFSALVFVDPRDFEVVATMRTNHHTLPRFIRATQYILSKIFYNAVFIIERNGVGGAPSQMMAAFLPVSRCYHDEKELPGIAMTKNLRDLMFNEILKTSVMEEMDKIHDHHIINEIVSLKMKRGRIDHEDGKHDDVLVAYLYTKWFLTYCTNKNKYIDPILIGCNRSGKKSKEELSLMMDKSFNSLRDGIMEFANNTGPTFLPRESANSKRRKQELYIQQMFDMDYITDRSDNIDKFLDKAYDIGEKDRLKEVESVDSYSITEDIKEEYVNDSNADKVDTEELSEKLLKDKELNKQKSAIVKEYFKKNFRIDTDI